MRYEFVVVRYPASRTVMVDGNRLGYTNTILVVEPGHHAFDLGKPVNYRPPTIERLVENTTVINPLVIEFERSAT